MSGVSIRWHHMTTIHTKTTASKRALCDFQLDRQIETPQNEPAQGIEPRATSMVPTMGGALVQVVSLRRELHALGVETDWGCNVSVLDERKTKKMSL